MLPQTPINDQSSNTLKTSPKSPKALEVIDLTSGDDTTVIPSVINEETEEDPMITNEDIKDDFENLLQHDLDPILWNGLHLNFSKKLEPSESLLVITNRNDG